MLLIFMKVVFDKKCLEYEFFSHPESPERVKKIKNVLEMLGAEFVKPEDITERELLKVHEKKFVERLKLKEYFDPDTPCIEFCYPLLSAACAVKAAKVCGFSLARPPGHHAGKNFLGGFCYLNNVAIALESIRKEDEKAVILDIDAHHGNGTENIFFGRENVLYISLHQHPLYSGTGRESRKNCINFPLLPYTTGALYLKTLAKAVEYIEKISPQIIAISLGFDTYVNDPLSQFMLSPKDFEEIGKIISGVLKNVEKWFIVLEGGYAEDVDIAAYYFFDGLWKVV